MDEFYVRLDCLDDLGKNRLPAVRDSLNAALAQLKEATTWIYRTFETESFTDPDKPIDMGMTYRHYLFWQPGNECYIAMDFMRQVFEDNAENVDLAGQAIREIAHRYRQADGQA